MLPVFDWCVYFILESELSTVELVEKEQTVEALQHLGIANSLVTIEKLPQIFIFISSPFFKSSICTIYAGLVRVLEVES